MSNSDQHADRHPHALTAVQFYGQRAHDFVGKYRQSRAFRERARIWERWIDQIAKPADTVLDIGSGPGLFSEMAARRVAHVTGFDGSDAMIAMSRANAIANGITNTDFVLGRIEDITLHFDRQFDLLLCSSVLEYMDDVPKTLRDMATLVKPGGLMLLSMPNAASRYRHIEARTFHLTGRPTYYRHVRSLPTMEQMEAWLAAADFTIRRHETFGTPPAHLLFKAIAGRRAAYETMILYEVGTRL